MDIEDTFWNIVKYIPMKHILQLQLLSKQHQQWIHNIPYSIRSKKIIRFERLKNCIQFGITIQKFQLINIDISDLHIDDNYDFIKKCDIVNTYGCSFKDEKIKKLSNCRSLFLSFKCDNYHLQYLTNIQDLYLANCMKIDNGSVQYISNCRRLDISGTNINEEILPRLSNCYGLAISGMKILDLQNIKCLKCKIIDLSYTNVDDNIIQYLVGRMIVNLEETNITGQKLGLLKNVRAINVPLNCMSNQQNLYNVEIKRFNFRISDNYFQTLFGFLMYGVYPDLYNFKKIEV